uniref:Uncharacterized protein n=1 Tax=Anguilla anguilla TaxID=7936 RepID=A0A0E9QTH2_ANGAN
MCSACLMDISDISFPLKRERESILLSPLPCR